MSRFIVDTWHEHGLITSDLYTRLPGLPTEGTGTVMMSGNMRMRRPFVHLGLQINNIRALPLPFFVVDEGIAPVLLGADFLELLFAVGLSSSVAVEPGAPPRATLESPMKRAPESVGIRLLPEGDTIEARELERFVSAVRRVHNVAALAELKLHQHDDWPKGSQSAKREAVARTIVGDDSLARSDRLSVRWIESGSIWVTLGSGIKTGVSWLSQIFKLSMDARLEATISGAASAREKAFVEQMTREDVIRAKQAEERLKAAKAVAEARKLWRETVLEEIDFKAALKERIADPVVREEAERQIEAAIRDLAETRLYPVVEHLPALPAETKDHLPARGPNADSSERG